MSDRRRVITAIDLAALVARLDAHDRRLAALEAIAPRDQADQQAAVAVATTTEALPFTSAALLRHATVTPALAAALLEVGLQTPAEVGAWLRDRVGTRNGITVCRLRGRQWRVMAAGISSAHDRRRGRS